MTKNILSGLAVWWLAFFAISCNVTSSDSIKEPELLIDPVTIAPGEDITGIVSTSVSILLPYCGGIIYEIQRYESDEWVTADIPFRICTEELFQQYIHVTDGYTFQQDISEEGIYRIITSYKSISATEWQWHKAKGQLHSYVGEGWNELSSTTFHVVSE